MANDTIKGFQTTSGQKQYDYYSLANRPEVAELDENGKVLSSQLPSYVDDVIEAASKDSFPTTGEAGKIYMAIDTNLSYRWSGSAYVEISPSLALGENATTAHRGDHGKAAYDHSQIKEGNPHGTTKAHLGLDKVENKSSADIIKEIDFPVDSVNGKTGSVEISASDIGALPNTTAIPDSLSDLTSDSTHRTVTDAEKTAWNAKSNFSGNYNDLTNKPTIPSITGLATESYVNNIANAKVDKVNGKGLSTNDYTTAEKTKLSGIATGANKTVVDTKLSSSSTNPVQNKVVNTAISSLNSLVGDTKVSTQISNAINAIQHPVYTGDESVDTSAEIINADTLGGHPVSDFFTNGKLGNLTHSDVGAAPAGYGLGGVMGKLVNSWAELDELDGIGWFAMAGSLPTINIAGHIIDWGWGRNEPYLYNKSRQVLYVDAGIILERWKVNGQWGEWEWENPPMTLGVEYRTTERHQGKSVYKKIVKEQLANNTIILITLTSTDSSIVSPNNVIDIDIKLSPTDPSSILPYYGDGNRHLKNVYMYGNCLELHTSSEGNEVYTAYVTFKYVKD